MFIQYISLYLEYLEIERGLSENTLEAYRRDLYSLYNFLVQSEIKEIFCSEKIPKTIPAIKSNTRITRMLFLAMNSANLKFLRLNTVPFRILNSIPPHHVRYGP